MPNYLFYDEQGKIYKKEHSISSHLIEEGLIEGYERTVKVDEEIYRVVDKFYLVDNGVLRQMTQVEKDALLAEEAEVERQSLIARIDKYEVSNLDLLTALVKRINVRIPSNPITKQEIIDQIKQDLGI